ncbi:MAG: thymidine kinase [Deltaproteobacteria bacterium]|jgi:thymidine kinase|nr:thymidine kinase [Deltaproteobacteria bacterium]
MFINQGRHSGWIEVVCGPMFSGKTEELIRRLRLSLIAKQRVQIFKPVTDNRYSEEHIVSHDDQKFLCTPVSESSEILEKIREHTHVIGVDEAQFFDGEIVDICQVLANRGRRVIVAGLDQDYLGVPFGPIPELMAIAESVLKLKAICMVCGGLATKTQRLTAETKQVLVGAKDHYEARCRACFDPELAVGEDDRPIDTAKNTDSVTRQISG